MQYDIENNVLWENGNVSMSMEILIDDHICLLTLFRN